MNTRIFVTAAAGALAAAVAAPAFAAGPTPVYEEPVIVQPTPVPAGTDWSGPYVGAQLGWGWANADGEGLDIDGDGVIGGLTAGYRYDFGRFVLGGEAQYDWADVSFDDDFGSIDEVGRIKAIAGYDAGRTLVYGSAGWTHAKASAGGEDLSDDGWVIGAGVDYLLTDRVAIGGEVQHHRFDDFDNTGVDVDATTLEAKVTFSF